MDVGTGDRSTDLDPLLGWFVLALVWVCWSQLWSVRGTLEGRPSIRVVHWMDKTWTTCVRPSTPCWMDDVDVSSSLDLCLDWLPELSDPVHGSCPCGLDLWTLGLGIDLRILILCLGSLLWLGSDLLVLLVSLLTIQSVFSGLPSSM